MEQTQRNKTFLIWKYSILKSTVVQNNRGWYWVNKKSYWLEGVRVGDGRAEGASETGDRGQAAIPYQQLMAQVLVPCWIQFCLPSWKTIQWCLSGSSFFLIIDATVALDYILNGCCNLHVPSYIGACASKPNSASSHRVNLCDLRGKHTFTSLNAHNLKVHI